MSSQAVWGSSHRRCTRLSSFAAGTATTRGGVTLKLMLAVVAALAAVALCVAGVAGAAKQTPGITFHLVEKDEAFNFVDNKPTSTKHAASIGDMFAFTSSLWTLAHKRAGSLQASCVVTTGGKHPVFECTGTFSLAGGQLEL